MKACSLCEEQAKKSRNSKPHENLIPVDDRRIFGGKKPQRFEEQDYQCTTCKTKFTHSTNANDIPWTMWRG